MGTQCSLCKNLHVGDNVKNMGTYSVTNISKRISEEETITKTAYEVSINRMELVEKKKEE